jgi:hypothetical protein
LTRQSNFNAVASGRAAWMRGSSVQPAHDEPR